MENPAQGDVATTTTRPLAPDDQTQPASGPKQGALSDNQRTFNSPAGPFPPGPHYNYPNRIDRPRQTSSPTATSPTNLPTVKNGKNQYTVGPPTSSNHNEEKGSASGPSLEKIQPEKSQQQSSSSKDGPQNTAEHKLYPNEIPEPAGFEWGGFLDYNDEKFTGETPKPKKRNRTYLVFVKNSGLIILHYMTQMSMLFCTIWYGTLHYATHRLLI